MLSVEQLQLCLGSVDPLLVKLFLTHAMQTIAHHLPRCIVIPKTDSCERFWRFFFAIVGDSPTHLHGAIDGKHTNITTTTKSIGLLHSEGYHSVFMQAVVDFRSRFLDVNISWPGKVHDARVLVNSSFYRKAISGTLVPEWSQNIAGINVLLLVLGDPAYPLLSWLMKPYIERPNSTREECNFNYRLSGA